MQEREEYERRKQQQLQELQRFRTTTYADSNEATRAYFKLASLRQELPQEYQQRAKRIQNWLAKETVRLDKEEYAAREEQREQEEMTNELAEYFSKHHSTTLPRWVRHYEQEIISKATTEYEKQKELEEQQRAQQEQEQKPIQAFLLEHRFYHANKLSREQREALLSHGYRFVPFVHLNGKPGNNLIIKNNPAKESDYHFCMKHLFSELDSRAQIEYPLAGQRYDVVYYRDLHRLAVEIETGANKPAHIRKKVAALSRYFDHWIIITNRQNKPAYRQYVDNEQSFCLTAKDAAEKVRAILATYSDS